MKKIIIILALFVFIASMGCVSAGNNSTVLIPIDPSGDFNELQGMIDDAGHEDVISLTKDYRNVENGSEISIVNKTLTINGNGHTLNASFESRIFNIDENSEVYLSNIKFTGGYDNYQGGAIYSDGQLLLSDCEFMYNAGYFGGAVFSTNSLHACETIFDTNYADSGGAIYSIGKLMVENSIFGNNYAQYSAGAIFCLRADTIINASIFSNNVADYYGGSVHGGQILSISDSIFTSTNEMVEIMDYYCTRELPNAYLYLENNIMDSPCPYSIYYESLNPIISPVTLEYAKKTTANGLKTEVAKIYDDMGNIIRYNDNFTMKIYDGSVLVEEVVLSYDEDAGGYFYQCDLSDGTYTLTGTLPNQFAENLTVIDRELIVENSSSRISSEVSLLCNINEDTVMLMALITPFDVTGYIIFRVNGVEYYGIVENASSILFLSDLDDGYYTASAIYEGDYMYTPSMSDDVSFKIGESKIPTELSVDDVKTVYNTAGAVVATLKDTYGNVVSGVNVKIAVGGLSKTAKTNKKGQVSLDISSLAPGEYKISARSSATSDIYEESKATAKAIVYADKIDTTLSVSDVIIIGNSTDVVVATLKDSYGNLVSGVNVRIVVGSLSITDKTDENGQVSLDILGLAPGEYEISARSSAKSKIYNEAKATAKAIVSEDKLDTTLTIPDVVTVYNTGGKVVATLKDTYGNVVSDINVKIVVGSLSKTARTDANGQLSLDISGLAPGEYKISARSSATSAIYKEAKATAKAIISTDKIDTTLTIPDVIAVGDSPAVVVATLKDSLGNVVSGVNVKIVVGSLSKTAKTDANGQVSMDISSLAPGEYKISARSSATSAIYKEAKATAKAILSEDKISTVLTAVDVITSHNSGKKLVTTLKDSYGNAIAGVKVRITVGTLDKILKTNSKGQAGLDVSTLDEGTYAAAIKSATTDIYKATKTTANVIINP